VLSGGKVLGGTVFIIFVLSGGKVRKKLSGGNVLNSLVEEGKVLQGNVLSVLVLSGV
jgi:hypothetical protein